jgi:hypothetical protein
MESLGLLLYLQGPIAVLYPEADKSSLHLPSLFL